MFSRPIPPLRKVGNGQILSFDLINSIIGRTEYAADLLQKNRLIAGSNISLSQNANGTIISSSLVSGAIPAPEVVPYRISVETNLGYAIYNPNTKNIEFLESGYVPSGIDDNIVCGTQVKYQPSFTQRGFYYDGATYTIFDHPDALYTRGRKTKGKIICGSYLDINSHDNYGYIYNFELNSFTTLTYPAPYTDTFIYGIFENYLCGSSFGVNADVSWLYDGENFTILHEYPSQSQNFLEPYAISKDYVVGYIESLPPYVVYGYLYNIKTEQVQSLMMPGASTTLFNDIYNNDVVVGFAVFDGQYKAIQYVISTNTFSLIDSPNNEIYFTDALAIG